VEVPAQRTASPTLSSAAQQQNGFGTSALVCACVGLALNLSPMFYALGVVAGVAAIVFGALAMRRARAGQAAGKGLAIAATAVGVLATAIGIIHGLSSTTSSPATPQPPTVTTTPAPQSTTLPPAAAAPTFTIPTPAGPAVAITARSWQLIAKDPAAHVGEHVIIYGHVTQFDAATGTTGFRADVDGIAHKPSYGYVNYPTNTVLIGDPAQLANLVQGDLFKAEAVVVGPYTYATTMGGQLTAPQMAVTQVTVTGSLPR
jgi:hypothetical protein